MRLQRLLAITIMLINRRKVTAPELADHFDISIRTVYRDIEAIQAAGIPVVSYQGYEGGFCIMDNYRISRQLLTFEDICSILGKLKGINTTLADRELDEVIEKIECLIPEEKESEFKNRSEQIVFDIAPWAGNDRMQCQLKELHQAINEQRSIIFEYTSMKLVETRRRVEPMTLVFKAHSWYLFGYCLERSDYRIFKLTRMRTIAVTDDRFIRREKSYREIMDGTMQMGENMVECTFLFAANTQVMAEDYFPPEQMRHRDDGTIEVKTVLPKDEWVYSWLLSFGSQVEVLEPNFIRDELVKRIEAIQSVYFEKY